MAELDNMFIKGTEGLKIGGCIAKSMLNVPVNQDWGFVGKITAYDDTEGIVQVQSVWDQDTSKKTYYAWARYLGRAGIPTSTEVEVDAYCVCYRTGVGNNGLTSAPSDFQLQDSSATTKASFIAFFFE